MPKNPLVPLGAYASLVFLFFCGVLIFLEHEYTQIDSSVFSMHAITPFGVSYKIIRSQYNVRGRNTGVEKAAD